VGHSQRLTHEQIRRVFRLLGEVRELGADPVAWRTRMLDGLTAAVGARVASAGEDLVPPDRPGAWIGVVDRGWDSALQRRRAYDALAQGIAQDPLYPHVQFAARRHPLFTRLREQFVDDRVWYSSTMASEGRRAAGLDDSIYSRHRLPGLGDWANMIALFRPWGERKFTLREARLVHLFHAELGRLWVESPLGKTSNAGDRALPPRLRQVLARLRLGEGEKQVATALGLSRQTVHSYVKLLYRHFGVGSRAELLLRAVPRYDFTPRLCDAAERQTGIDGSIVEPPNR
jgi:DNA-binding CsgD family transcriptional regulator